MLIAAALAAGCTLPGEHEASGEAVTGATTVSFQEGVAPSSRYAGTRDTYLSQNASGSNYGGASALRADGDDPGGSGRDVSALLSWDVSAIPPGSTVHAASLTINVTNASSGVYTVYALRRAWTERQATWNVAASGASWQIAGARGADDRGTTALGTVSARSTGRYTVRLNAAGIAVVQGWVNDPSSNRGLIIAGADTADGLDFSSSEASTSSRRPRLSVSYTPPAADADAGTADATDGATDGSTTDGGTTDGGTTDGGTTDGGTSPAGTTYYVDSVSGSDANAGTSETSAWRSLAKASSAPLAPGDRLLFRRGGRWTGSLTVSRSGTAQAPVFVGAYGAGVPPVIGGGSNCANLDGSYIELADLHLDDCTWAGVSVRGSYDTVRNARITRNAAGVHLRSGANHNRVLHSALVDNNKMSVLTMGGNDDSGAFGVVIHGDANEVAHNTIQGCDAFSYDYGRDGGAVEIYGGRFNYIHHNVAVDNDAFTELGNPRASDNTFAYNVVRSSLETSVFAVTRGAGSGYGPVARTRLYNNTVYLTGSRSQGFVCHAGCGPDILVMRNNVIRAAWKVGYADAPFDEDHGVYHGGARQFVLGPHSRVADPLFVDPAANDLHVRAGSPAIDTGSPLLDYRFDLDGVAVPQDGDGDGAATVDVGAYEFRR